MTPRISREEKGKGKDIEECGFRNTNPNDLTSETLKKSNLTEKSTNVRIRTIRFIPRNSPNQR